MSKQNSEEEIEEAQRQVRGKALPNKEEKIAPQKKEEHSQKQGEKITEKSEEKKAAAEIIADESQQRRLKQEIDLEEIAHKSQPLRAELHDSQYVEQLSHKPMGELYQEAKQLYKIAEDKGYLSLSEQRQVEYLSSAVERKFEAEEQGVYSFSEQAARAASITQQLSASMMGSYKGKKNEMYRS